MKKHTRYSKSILIENQSLSDQHYYKFSVQVAAAVSRRLDFIANFVSLQPLWAAPGEDDGTVVYLASEKNEETDEINITVKTRQAKSERHEICKLNQDDLLEENAYYLVNKIVNHIENKIFDDLKNEATTKSIFDFNKDKDFILELNCLFHRIYLKALRGPVNWAVCHPEVQNLLLCSLNKVKVFTREEQPKNEVIFGYSGISYNDNGYIFTPCVVANIEKQKDGHTLASYYNGWFIPDRGKDYYGVLTLENYNNLTISQYMGKKKTNRDLLN